MRSQALRLVTGSAVAGLLQLPIETATVDLCGVGSPARRDPEPNIEQVWFAMSQFLGSDREALVVSGETPPPTRQFGSMADTAYQKIKRMILSSRLVAGQKILYADLGRALNMSKTPVISALSRLESEGYVSQKRNRGYYVKEFDPKEIAELMQAREVLEVANVDAVMNNITDDEIAEIVKIHLEYREYSPHFFDQKKSALNSRFHLALARTGKNRFLMKYVEHVYEWMDLRIRFNMLPPARVKESAVEHARMIEALWERDRAGLKRLLTKHIRKPTGILLEHVEGLELLPIWR
jgi:DNA-binding GntR family transcriptional regulator